MEIHKKIAEDTINAEKLLGSADHLANVTYQALKEPKILSMALEDIYKSNLMLVSSILKFEYVHNNILLSNNNEENMSVFFEKCAGKCGLSSSGCSRIKEIMLLGRKHKESGFEFAKGNKIIILDDEAHSYELNEGKINGFLDVSKALLKCAKKEIIALR